MTGFSLGAMPRRLRAPLARPGQRGDDVRRDDALRADPPGGADPGETMEANGGTRGGERLDALGEDGAQDAGEDVSGARGGERGRGAGADGDPAVRLGHQRVVALEDDDRAAGPGGLASMVQAPGLDRSAADPQQAAELALVRR